MIKIDLTKIEPLIDNIVKKVLEKKMSEQPFLKDLNPELTALGQKLKETIFVKLETEKNKLQTYIDPAQFQAILDKLAVHFTMNELQILVQENKAVFESLLSKLWKRISMSGFNSKWLRVGLRVILIVIFFLLEWISGDPFNIISVLSSLLDMP